MTYNIRPLSFGEVLDSAFTVFRDNFVLLAGIALIIGVPVETLVSAAQKAHLGGLVLLGMLLALVLEPVMLVAFTVAVANIYLDRPITIGDAYRSVGRIFGPFFGTVLLADLLLMLAVLALIVPAIYFGVCWCLIFPVMIVEHRFGMSAMRRSRLLVSGVWWRTLGIIVVAALIARVPAMVLSMVWSFIPILGVVLTAATLSIAQTYSLIVFVIYYFDRRCRIEDFDLRLLADQIRADLTSAAPPPQPAPAN